MSQDDEQSDLWRPDKAMGLGRLLAKAGYGSRTQTRILVESGRVRIDGQIAVDPATTVEPENEVRLDGKLLREVHRCYYAFHKPAHVISVPNDPGGTRQVKDFLPSGVPGLMPAGRLDANTTGLMLVSNDNAWNDRVTSGQGLEKEYRIQVTGQIGDLELGVISAGMHLPNLGFVRPAAIEVLEQTATHCWVRFVVTEAKNRQVRRVFHILRHDVVVLRRVRIGSIRLGDLAAGRLRPLTGAEIEGINALRTRSK